MCTKSRWSPDLFEGYVQSMIFGNVKLTRLLLIGSDDTPHNTILRTLILHYISRVLTYILTICELILEVQGVLPG